MMRKLLYWRKLFFLYTLLTCSVVVTRAQDYPPASSNLQTAPAGTLVIAMDNINQATSVVSSNTGTYLFNLKAYGLAIFLQDLDYDLQWVIRTGKVHDGVDFTATAERAWPTYDAPRSYDFRAGPLIIFPSDTLDIQYAIAWFNSYQFDSSKVKVYRLTSPATVDVRYSLTKRVRAALLYDSCDIHRNFMEVASVPTMNYDCLPDALSLRAGCYTVATEPHTEAADVDQPNADSIYSFLMAGGNFLAQCKGIKTFELLKKFHSLTGEITETTGGGGSGTYNNNVEYTNADMAYGQIHGAFSPHLRGALRIYLYNSATTNNWYPVIRTKLNPASAPYYYAAAVSKLTGGEGSLVFYLGNHEYVTHDCHETNDCTSWAFNEREINGIRLFLNAILIPAAVPDCIFNIPLAVQMNEFTAFKKNNDAVQLNWVTQAEDEKTVFFVEHSKTGSGFSIIGEIAGTGSTSAGDDYNFLHTGPTAGVNFYRLKIISASGKLTYSEIRRVMFDSNHTLNLFPNPATGKTKLQLDLKDGARLQVSFYDATGRQVRKTIVTIRNQQAELTIDGLNNGIYWVIASTAEGKQFTSKLQVLK